MMNESIKSYESKEHKATQNSGDRTLICTNKNKREEENDMFWLLNETIYQKVTGKQTAPPLKAEVLSLNDEWVKVMKAKNTRPHKIVETEP